MRVVNVAITMWATVYKSSRIEATKRAITHEVAAFAHKRILASHTTRIISSTQRTTDQKAEKIQEI